jgi:hypothetical protein
MPRPARDMPPKYFCNCWMFCGGENHEVKRQTFNKHADARRRDLQDPGWHNRPPVQPAPLTPPPPPVPEMPYVMPPEDEDDFEDSEPAPLIPPLTVSGHIRCVYYIAHLHPDAAVCWFS